MNTKLPTLTTILVLFTCSICHGEDYTYWINPNGSMHGITAAETTKRFEQGLSELSATCNVNFIKRTRKAGSDLKISFKTQNQIYRGALGVAYVNSGVIYINSTRDVGLNRKYNRIAQAVLVHEVMHVIGFDHSADIRCIMNANLSSSHLCKTEVRRLQNFFGIKYKLFYPTNRTEAAQKLAETTTKYNTLNLERAKLIAERDASTDPIYRSAKQSQILNNLIEIIITIPVMVGHAQDWFAFHIYWQGVPDYAGNILNF